MSAGFDLVGPFEEHVVVVNGWKVPYLTGVPRNGGRIDLTLDSRMGIDLSVEDAERLVPFIADCIAVALGYTAHPGIDGLTEPRRSVPFTRMHAL